MGPARLSRYTQDPYANAYSKQWRKATDLSKFERMLGRGGWVGTRNYELDSGAYFISMVRAQAASPAALLLSSPCSLRCCTIFKSQGLL